MTLIYSTLLERAVHVGMAVEAKMTELDAEALKLTAYLDKFHLAGGSKGKYFYLAAASVVPIFLIVLFVWEVVRELA